MTLQPNPYSKNNFIWDLSNHEEDANLNKSDQDYKSNLSPSVSDETIGSDESPSQSAGSSRQNTSSNAYNLYWATQNSLFRPILTSTSIINNLTQSYSDASEEFYGSSLECSRSSSECSRSSSSSSIQNSPSHPILTSTSILNNLSKSDSDMLEEFHDSSVECPRSSSSSSSQRLSFNFL
jgi:hypothetical protein